MRTYPSKFLKVGCGVRYWMSVIYMGELVLEVTSKKI